MIVFIKKYFLFFVALCVGLYFLYNKKYKPTSSKNENFRLETYEVGTQKWSYKIWQDNKLVIDQQYIPGTTGDVRFVNKNEAQKIGELMISKLKKEVFPPTVTETELKENQIQIPAQNNL